MAHYYYEGNNFRWYVNQDGQQCHVYLEINTSNGWAPLASFSEDYVRHLGNPNIMAAIERTKSNEQLRLFK